MAFNEVQFPSDISYGSSGGPGFSTTIQRLDSGGEIRVARWAQAKHKFDVSYGIKNMTQLTAVLEFYHARKGPANGFRYKDWMDFTSNDDNRGAYAFGDQNLGIADGSTRTIQLRKKYTDGTTTVYRNIEKPVNTRWLVGFDTGSGVVANTNEGSDWSIASATGVLTVLDATYYSATVYAGFEFDVPVRFGDELDDHLPISQDAFDIGSIGSIPLIEIEGGAVVEDDVDYGGIKIYTTGGVTVDHGMFDGRNIMYTASSGQLTINLPTVTALWPDGGPYFWIINKSSGSGTILVKKSAVDGAASLRTLAAGEGCVMMNASGTGSSATGGWQPFP